jgi:hypothetical protein
MIATLDRLKALYYKLEGMKPDEHDRALQFFSGNEILLLKRLVKDYIEESEEVLAIGQLQDYNNDHCT